MGRGGNAWLCLCLSWLCYCVEVNWLLLDCPPHLAPQVWPTLTPPMLSPTVHALRGPQMGMARHSGGSCPVSGTLLLVSARAAECSDYSERVSHEFPFKQTILSNWETHHIQHVYPQHTPTHLDLIVREHFKTLMPQEEGWGVWQLSLTDVVFTEWPTDPGDLRDLFRVTIVSELFYITDSYHLSFSECWHMHWWSAKASGRNC